MSEPSSRQYNDLMFIAKTSKLTPSMDNISYGNIKFTLMKKRSAELYGADYKQCLVPRYFVTLCKQMTKLNHTREKIFNLKFAQYRTC